MPLIDNGVRFEGTRRWAGQAEIPAHARAKDKERELSDSVWIMTTLAIAFVHGMFRFSQALFEPLRQVGRAAVLDQIVGELRDHPDAPVGVF